MLKNVVITQPHHRSKYALCICASRSKNHTNWLTHTERHIYRFILLHNNI